MAARPPDISTYPPGFISGLRALRWVEGQHYVLEYRFADGRARLPVLAAELVALPVDVIVAVSTPTALAAKADDRRIPELYERWWTALLRTEARAGCREHRESARFCEVPSQPTCPSSNPRSSSWSSTVRPEKADVFSGSQSRRGKSQSPVTRMAAWRGTETLKPIDQALGRRVSESPGRNESERRGGPERLQPRRPSPMVERRRPHGPSQLADAAGHSGGVRATAR